jgi:hypothetical protein
MSSVVLTALFSSGLFGEPCWPIFIESGDQPPALSAAIAVIQIDLEDVSFCIFDDKIATVPPSVPFTAAGWKTAMSGINAFTQHFDYIMNFSVPRETPGLRRCFGLFNLDLFTEKFFHRGMLNDRSQRRILIASAEATRYSLYVYRRSFALFRLHA